jgi:hypothetical protein
MAYANSVMSDLGRTEYREQNDKQSLEAAGPNHLSRSILKASSYVLIKFAMLERGKEST